MSDFLSSSLQSRVVSRSIDNDTEFLLQQMVMDYLVLVGTDEAKTELVLGSIGKLVKRHSLDILSKLLSNRVVLLCVN